MKIGDKIIALNDLKTEIFDVVDGRIYFKDEQNKVWWLWPQDIKFIK